MGSAKLWRWVGATAYQIFKKKKKLTNLIRNNVFVFILNMISVCLRSIKTWITLQYPSNCWKITPGTNISTFSLIFQCFKRTPDQRWILTRAIICRFAGYQKTQESGIDRENSHPFFIRLARENNHMHTPYHILCLILSAYF